ncbi:MAG: peptidoglycan-binding protein [Rhodospirillaceae bacterium]|nr:peptidoglycan-binding protein [Rhodospirillaceae bacterium]
MQKGIFGRVWLVLWLIAVAPVFAARQDEPAAISAAEPGLIAALVANIQERLATLGFYTASGLGDMDATTIAAIRAYQTAWRLPPDGLPTVALLEHIATSVQMRRMTDQLEARATPDDAAARAALLENAETRDLMGPEPEAARSPAPGLELCLAAPTAACLLEAAVNSAAVERASWLRDWAFGEIVAVQARAGLSDEARATLRRITDARLVVVSLGDMAAGLARGGRVAEAQATAATVPDLTHRLRALLEIANVGTPEAARAILLRVLGEVSSIADPTQRLSTTAAAAVALHRVGDSAAATGALSAARRLLETDRTVADRAAAAAAIATAFAEIDRTGEAITVLSQVSDRSMRSPALLAIARAEARAGETDAALATLDGVSESGFRAAVLADIAVERSMTGNLDIGRKLLVQSLDAGAAIGESFARSYAVAAATRAMIELDWIDDATRLARSIADPGLRAQFLWRIAAIQAKGGMREAPTTELQAVVATSAVESRLTRVWVLAEAAAARIRDGDREGARRPLDRAIREADAIPVGWTNARALTRIADVFIELQ